MVRASPAIMIGERFFMNRGCHLFGEISIGNDVSIGPQTVIWARNHIYKSRLKTISEQGHVSSKIEIGDDVWIGAHCTILSGVKIGKGAVIGAGCVVVKNVEPYTINVGNPSRVIGYRGAEEA
jgi:maltose O-acetyltransferase